MATLAVFAQFCTVFHFWLWSTSPGEMWLMPYFSEVIFSLCVPFTNQEHQKLQCSTWSGTFVVVIILMILYKSTTVLICRDSCAQKLRIIQPSLYDESRSRYSWLHILCLNQLSAYRGFTSKGGNRISLGPQCRGPPVCWQSPIIYQVQYLLSSVHTVRSVRSSLMSITSS